MSDPTPAAPDQAEGPRRTNRMQAKDVPDAPILAFLRANKGRWATWGDSIWMPTVRDAMPPGTPAKVQLAKMRSLIKRGLVNGCNCGCRGDFEIVDDAAGTPP